MKDSFLFKCFNKLAKIGMLNWLPDKKYLELMYKYRIGKTINWENPTGFNEKLQCMKIYDRNPLYTILVDKFEVKSYVAKILGDDYVIPTLGVWNSFEEIDFDKLPNQFVLKCTHDSGSIVICKDKNMFDLDSARKKLNKGLSRNMFYWGREWPYKNVPKRIIAEKYLQDSNSANQLTDYKIYTFNGIAKLMMINKDRGNNTKADYYDKDFNWLDFTWGYPHADIKPEKPQNFEKMFELAEALAVGLPEVRVDFYEVDRKILFGELTFFDGSGFDKILPDEWDIKLGSFLKGAFVDE